MVHRPLPDSQRQLDNGALLAVSTWEGCYPTVFELQLQVRFKVVPRAPLWVGLELREGGLRLNPVTRLLASALLRALKAVANQRGAELTYSLGEHAHAATHVTRSRRMFRSDGAVPLPIMYEGRLGTWHWAQGEWTPVERGPDFFDDRHYYTFALNTAHIDWNSWELVNTPVGPVGMSLFTGQQPIYAVLYDEVDGSARRFMDLEFLPPDDRVPEAELCEVSCPLQGGDRSEQCRGQFEPNLGVLLSEVGFQGAADEAA